MFEGGCVVLAMVALLLSGFRVSPFGSWGAPTVTLYGRILFRIVDGLSKQFSGIGAMENLKKSDKFIDKLQYSIIVKTGAENLHPMEQFARMGWVSLGVGLLFLAVLSMFFGYFGD